MGNAPDKTVDKTFMLRHAQLSDQFLSSQVLYHVEDIKFPLYTDQMKIVDSTGRRVKLAGGNWSGGHMCRHCVDGLQCRPMKDIANDIRFKFKMNCIRLTYSLQLIYDNNVVPEKYLKANPDLIGKTSMEIFDITVRTLTQVGLMVILNNHTSTSQWCCSNDDGDGLWWSREYPQYMFFDHVRDFAKRYKNNQRVIGMDMRNQIRKAHGIEPTWGDGNPKTDWKRAAQISSQIALKQAPHWLILIGGLNYQLDLTGIKQSPIQLSVSNKLVYSGHFYGFSWPIPSWSIVTYDNFKKRLFNSQTYVRTLGVPYLLGQFGNNNQDIPWQYLMRYLKETDIDWTYWALDGFKCDRDKDQTYGVFTNDFSTARHPEMLQDMIDVGPPKKALDNYWSYIPGKSHKNQSQNIELKQYNIGKQQKINSRNYTQKNFQEKKKDYFQSSSQVEVKQPNPPSYQYHAQSNNVGFSNTSNKVENYTNLKVQSRQQPEIYAQQSQSSQQGQYKQSSQYNQANPSQNQASQYNQQVQAGTQYQQNIPQQYSSSSSSSQQQTNPNQNIQSPYTNQYQYQGYNQSQSIQQKYSNSSTSNFVMDEHASNTNMNTNMNANMNTNNANLGNQMYNQNQYHWDK